MNRCRQMMSMMTELSNVLSHGSEVHPKFKSCNVLLVQMEQMTFIVNFSFLLNNEFNICVELKGLFSLTPHSAPF